MKRPRLGRPSSPAPGLPFIPRLFAVLAAVLLVGSVALASLLPTDMTLIQALHALDEASPAGLQEAIVGTLGRGVWEAIAVPVLVRPIWLVPVSLGLICVGGAVTAHSHATPRTKQRRS